MNDLYPFLFEPILRKAILGDQLKPYKGLEPADDPIGESWERTYAHSGWLMEHGRSGGCRNH